MTEPTEPTLAELVQTFTMRLHDAVGAPTRAEFTALHAALNLIEFTLLVDRSAGGLAPPPGPELKRGLLRCSAPGCRVTWRTPDACLLLVNGSWLCRQHHPSASETVVQDDGTTVHRQRSHLVGYAEPSRAK